MIRQRVSFLDLDKIAASGQCFRWMKTGERAYAIPAFGETLLVCQPAPDVVEADCAPESWERLWRPYFDLDADYLAYAKSVDPKDEYLSAALRSAWGVRVLKQPLWETMLSFLISQNNNIPRIQKTVRCLCGGEREPIASPERLLGFTAEELRGAGLGYRAPYVQKAAAKYLADGLSDGASFANYGEARAYLTTYCGVGPKVADCICLYALGFKDAFPMDVWMKRIVKTHYAGAFPLFRYQGFAGVLQQWMFFYERQGR